MRILILVHIISFECIIEFAYRLLCLRYQGNSLSITKFPLLIWEKELKLNSHHCLMDLLLLSRKLNNSEKSLCSSLKNESLENPTLIPKERDPIINLQVVNHKTKVLTWIHTSSRTIWGIKDSVILGFLRMHC